MAKRKSTKPAAKTPAGVVKARIAEAGKRALAEAQARRRSDKAAEILPPERGGQPGPEPTRYGDWEKEGHHRGFLTSLDPPAVKVHVRDRLEPL